ncbi:MAG TPA: hypothetical protein VJP07_05630 [Dehalococcoidia bacterium]|nr:hypothetical protein [Dehalococcoidia bacterium]
MAWNTARAKYRSDELANLDCSPNTRQARTSETRLWGSITFATTKTIAAGECVAMVRVPAGAVILGGQLTWARTAAGTCVPRTVLAVGDPFACGRLAGPIDTLWEYGAVVSGGAKWGECGRISKMGVVGDGCGVGYTYTCETDIFLTNLNNEALAFVGGSTGAATVPGGIAGSALTSGKFTLIVDIKPV